MGKLTATQVKALKQPGRYHDGEGLMLAVSASGSASWLLRIQAKNKRREFGLGSLKSVSLAQAREDADKIRRVLGAGLDPVAERRRVETKMPTFEAAARQFHATNKIGWKNKKHAAQWLNTLIAYAFPLIGKRTVDQIDAPLMWSVLGPIWQEKPETARRVRQRMATVLDYANAHGWRETEAPIRALAKIASKQQKAAGHFAAMPYSEVPALLKRLREAEQSWGRLALQAAILTACRSGEVRGATWDEIDLDARTWTIPAARMKMGKEHRVPLSNAAAALFERAAKARHPRSNFVFHGIKPQRPMSDMTLLKVLRDMGLSETVHGFRSSFRDWVSEETNFAPELAEAALAHTIQNKTEAAYRRGDLFEKRRKMMEAWARFLDEAPADVIRPPSWNRPAAAIA